MLKVYIFYLSLFIVIELKAQNYTLTDSLIAVYHLNGNALDSTENLNNGVVIGAITATDRFGNSSGAYYFDGINDYIDITPGLNFKPTTFPISICAWARVTGGIGQGGAFFSNDCKENYYNGVNMAITTNTNNISALYGDGGLCYPDNRRNKVGVSNIGDSTWHLYTVVFRGPTDMDIYIDCRNDSGVYLGTGNGLAYSNAHGAIGRFDQQAVGNPTYFYFKGIIDEIRFYHRELFPEDIYKLMQLSPFNLASVTLADTTLYCGNSFNLTPNWSGNSLLWSNGATASSISISQSGSYSVTVTDNYGCSASDQTYVTIVNNEITISDDTTICKGQSAVLSASSLGNWQWLPDSSLNCTSCPFQSISPAITTTYTLVTNYLGCLDTLSVVVNVNDYIITTVNPAYSQICKGDSVLIQASGLNSYIWFPSVGLNTTNQSTVIASPLQTTTYFVYSQNETCVIGSQVTIKVDTMPSVSFIPDREVCAGDSVFISLVTNAQSVFWSPSIYLDCVTCTENLIYPQSDVSYTVIYSNGDCVDSTIFNIDVNDFTVYAGNDTTIQEGSYVLLNASQAASYQWSPPDFLSNTNTNPTLSVPLTTITYTLTAYDNNGCKAQDSIIITVLQDCGKQIVPSSFTPNGDGKNDLFRILSQYDFNLIDFTIYNRWGQNIFYTTNTSIGWDGTLSNNTPAEIGVYVYIIRYLCNGAEKMIKGNVTLLR